MQNPYSDLPPQAFWKSGVVEADKRRWPEIYPPIFEIGPQTAVATAGSCFAQHIGRGLRGAGGNFLDVETKPEGMQEEEAVRHGYGLYSARYGNIYTARHLRELLEDAFEIYVDERQFMTCNGTWFDALRPGVEPDGFATLDDATEARRAHLLKVVELALEMEVFVFTLGLTEGWIDRETGRVLAMAPGVIAGDFNPARYVFHNFTFDEVYADLVEIRRLLNGINPHVKLLLTVSSVPLAETASGAHVLAATTYSKSVLRAAAGDLAETYETVDYFPAYEIVATWAAPKATFTADRCSVRPEMVARAMEVFLSAHGLRASEG